MKNLLILMLGSFFLVNCSTLQNNAKYELSDGKYNLKSEKLRYKCYVENNNDSIVIHPLMGGNETQLFLTKSAISSQKYLFKKSSFDIDVMTVLFKIRPSIKNILPTQLNSSFNGNIYLGHRTDIYQIKYKTNPIKKAYRQINHYGFSGGGFVGLGNGAINPSTTNNKISSDYEGLILQKGFAVIIAVNKLTIGTSIGIDNLLGQNKSVWIYQNKPWFGLMLGLNLN